MAEIERREQQKECAMSQQQSQTATTTTTRHDEPDAERQAELRAAYESNVAAGRPPYQHVRILTLGALHWILRERDWSGDLDCLRASDAPTCGGPTSSSHT
jgi:hypothetical protein